MMASSSRSAEPREPPESSDAFRNVLLPALLSGAVQAVLFNPIDRALYLRVHHRRSLVHPHNWTTPFQGFGNAAVYRTICGGSYLFWQDMGRAAIVAHAPQVQHVHPSWLQFGVGVFAGSLNGLMLNQLQIVKYRMWSDNHGTFLSVSQRMWKDVGASIFFRGVSVSMLRDVTFGITYEVMRVPHRTERHPALQFLCNSLAAMVASIISSPINYCRNLIYGAPSVSCPLRVGSMLRLLALEAVERPTSLERFSFLNGRLNVGWGSVRVGVGMAIGQLVFHQMKLLSSVMRAPPSRA